MKRIEHQLRRLLRAAAVARPSSPAGGAAAPDARWLLRQRERGLEAGFPLALRPVLRGGLAVACLLLLVASLVNARRIEQANRDVFAVSEAALTRLVTP